MIQKVFNRYEKKYLLDQKTYEVFKKELDVYMAEESTYFLEIKKKYNGLVNKRRIPLSRLLSDGSKDLRCHAKMVRGSFIQIWHLQYIIFKIWHGPVERLTL